ncbi:MAG: apolipoprotein N-acyltransferase [Deltaproteobacteria bacterium]|nr:apolipoprotein N-acyltransferase [Deltaproteobacteria bacterium]
MNFLPALFFSTLSGFLIVLGFPKVELAYLLFFAFVPLLFVIDHLDIKKCFYFGTLTGFVVYLLGFSWMQFTLKEFGGFHTLTAFFVFVLFSLLSGSFFGFFGSLTKLLQKYVKLSFLILAPLVYTILEYSFPTLFPWHIGGGFYKHLIFIQFVDITGTYGLSFFIVFINVVFYEALKSYTHKSLFPWKAMTIAILLSFSLFLYGKSRIETVVKAHQNKKELRLALLQTNVANFEKSIESMSDLSIQEQVHQRNAHMAEQAVKSQPDLIVFPETSVPGSFNLNKNLQLRMFQLSAHLKTPLYFGGYADDSNEAAIYYNTAYLISENYKILGRYDKNYLLMFGEYMPFSSLFPSLKNLIKEVSNFTAGTLPKVFTFKGEKLGALICYEDLIPSFVRKTVLEGATFLLNLANDSWFGESACPYQHLALSVFRSIEHKLPLVRATNTGVSSIIYPTGEIAFKSELGEQSILYGGIRPPHLKTFYTQYGNVFVLVCGIFLFFIMLWGFFFKHKL